jgi:hypothetical protein
MENKQTAVDWLFEQIFKDINTDFVDKLKVKAKAMEREQIEDAYNYGYLDYQILAHDNAVMYYEVNYGKPTPKPFA